MTYSIPTISTSPKPTGLGPTLGTCFMIWWVKPWWHLSLWHHSYSIVILWIANWTSDLFIYRMLYHFMNSEVIFIFFSVKTWPGLVRPTQLHTSSFRQCCVSHITMQQELPQCLTNLSIPWSINSRCLFCATQILYQQTKPSWRLDRFAKYVSCFNNVLPNNRFLIHWYGWN